MKLKPNSFVGVIDSGVGGITVLHELIKEIPYMDFIFIADTKNLPYGTKLPSEILSYVTDIAARMIEAGAVGIVVACNTATSVAIEELRKMYDIPIVGMEPAIKPALAMDDASVAVLATEVTLSQKKFNDLVHSLDAEGRIIRVPSPYLVEVAETMLPNTEQTKEAVIGYVQKVIPEGISTIVLGCTHFVYFKNILSEKYLNVVDGNAATSHRLMQLLHEKYDIDTDDIGMYSIDNTAGDEDFNKKARHLLQILEESK